MRCTTRSLIPVMACLGLLIAGCSDGPPSSDREQTDTPADSNSGKTVRTEVVHQPDVAEPLAIKDVRYWAYQIQQIDAPGAIDALAASAYDMLVIEPTRTDWSSETRFFDTAATVARLKASRSSDGQHRKLVIAYIDIGEAEDWRWYWTWSTEFNPRKTLPKDWPAFILTIDPDGWSGNYPVAYWRDDWKDIVLYGEHHPATKDREYISIVDEVVRDGFDGVYLDWVEGFEDKTVIARAKHDGVDPADQMIKLIDQIREYGRQRNPDFLVIQQNGSALLQGHDELLHLIDAIAQEEVWFDGDATDDWADPAGCDHAVDPDDSRELIASLQRFQNAGVPVFNCEYARRNSAEAYRRSYEYRFIPYCTRRSLSQLTTTPPPDLRH